MNNIKIDCVAFEKTERNYEFVAHYLTEPKQDALIQIFKDTKLIREFLWPAYKIWNVGAHARDIVEGLEENSDWGLELAGWGGL